MGVSGSLPPALVAAVEDWVTQLTDHLGPRVVTAQLFGSIPDGEFHPATSDIDFCVAVSQLSKRDLSLLEELHRRLARTHPFGRRFDGCYAEFDRLASGDVVETFPAFRDGRSVGRVRLPAVARRQLRRGDPLLGRHASEWLPNVSDEQVRDEMRYNLVGYWRSRRRRPWLFLNSTMTDFAVTGVTRTLYTLRSGQLIGKYAATWLAQREFPRVKPLAVDARARMRGDRSRAPWWERARHATIVLRFIDDAIARGSDELAARQDLQLS